MKIYFISSRLSALVPCSAVWRTPIERIFFIFLLLSQSNNKQKTTTFNLFAARNYVRDEIENRCASQKSFGTEDALNFQFFRRCRRRRRFSFHFISRFQWPRCHCYCFRFRILPFWWQCYEVRAQVPMPWVLTTTSVYIGECAIGIYIRPCGSCIHARIACV